MDPHVLAREQWLPAPVETVFAFFAEARNLEAITPPWLNFRIRTPGPIDLRAGSRIAYRISWHGVPLRWLTEIAAWDPPHGFTDVQVRGPYRLWHHVHTFEPAGAGTRMRDVVTYRLPFGPVGRVAHRWRVRRDLEAIFDYRARAVADVFPGS
ncbi:MAG TPA: SRPBCC family protein [Gemmataceae bacterium]|jgi:ligand-binding SRPBCC domain-containing protein|nr:SRPBCC family protein [Gemmataceae bacterium]